MVQSLCTDYSLLVQMFPSFSLHFVWPQLLHVHLDHNQQRLGCSLHLEEKEHLLKVYQMDEAIIKARLVNAIKIGKFVARLKKKIPQPRILQPQLSGLSMQAALFTF